MIVCSICGNAPTVHKRRLCVKHYNERLIKSIKKASYKIKPIYVDKRCKLYNEDKVKFWVQNIDTV